MGLLEKIFGKNPQPQKGNDGFFTTLNAYTPAFTTWGGQIYESDLVRSAIHTRAVHISKLSVEIHGTAKPKLRAKLSLAPNQWQSWSQFLYRTSTILDVDNTAFIVPVMDDYMETSGIYTVRPTLCQIVQYNNTPWLRYQFSTGEYASIELSRCGILTKFQLTDDFFGDSNAALNPTMEMIHIQTQGISEAVKSSATYRFYAQLSNFANATDLAEERKRFTRDNLQEGGGVLLFPNTYSNIKQIEPKPYVVDEKQMQAIKQNVFDYFNVNEDVLQNKAFGDAWSAFYEGVPEWFSIQFGEVVTKMLFTERERAMKNYVMATANRLQYLSTQDKINFAKEMGALGGVMIDEIREVFNLPPLPNGLGQKIPVRGEYYFLGENPIDETKGGTNGNT